MTQFTVYQSQINTFSRQRAYVLFVIKMRNIDVIFVAKIVAKVAVRNCFLLSKLYQGSNLKMTEKTAAWSAKFAKPKCIFVIFIPKLTEKIKNWIMIFIPSNRKYPGWRKSSLNFLQLSRIQNKNLKMKNHCILKIKILL